MKKILFLVVALCFYAQVAFGISMTGLKTTGILPANTHSHITTKPCRIYAIDVTPTATTYGFAQLIETNGSDQDNDSVAGWAGSGFISGRATKVKADIIAVVANVTIHCEYPKGIDVQEQLFVDAYDATIQVYYKE